MENPTCPSILYQNPSKTVTLIDIPTSIAEAQLHPHELTHSQPDYLPRLLSCSPIQEPYPSLEPKSERARANVSARQGAQVDDGEFKKLIYSALAEIRKNHRGDWCRPRSLLPQSLSRKRKCRSDEEEKVLEGDGLVEPDLQALSRKVTSGIIIGEITEIAERASSAPLSETGEANLPSCSSIPIISHNPTPSRVSHTIPTMPPCKYSIPSNSSFSFMHINPSTASLFSTALSHLADTQCRSLYSSKFDLIILDPPWHNKSVTRSRHYATRRDDPLFSLRPMLGTHVVENGVLACWITNKASARAEALECFRSWGVQLTEEWVWLKVTVKGEPVYDVEGVWKKPFEVLLVGRKEAAGDGVADEGKDQAGGAEGVKRRLIVGVPDLHSRKPSLRALMEPLVGKGEGFRALEGFARNLTAGWLAWGNEVLKYNWEAYWTNVVDDARENA